MHAHVHDTPTRLPLTAAQHAIWVAQSLSPSAPFSVAVWADLSGPIDPDRLRAATLAALRSAESPLQVIQHGDEGVWQAPTPFSEETFVQLDFCGAADAVAAARDWMHADLKTPVDVTAGGLCRVALATVGRDRHFWYARFHHILLDGYGAAQILRHIAAHYNGEHPPAMTPLRSIVSSDAAYSTSTRYERDRAFWARYVQSFPEPLTLGSPAAQCSAVNHTAAAPLPPVMSSHTAALAALTAYLGRVSGRQDVVVGLPVSARTSAALRNGAGMVANVVPLRVAVNPACALTEHSRVLHAELGRVLRHHRFPQAEIHSLLARPEYGRMFGPAVNLLRTGDVVSLGQARGSAHILSSGPVDDVAINLCLTPAGVRAEWETNPYRHSQSDTDAWCADFADFAGFYATHGRGRTLGTVSRISGRRAAAVARSGLGAPARQDTTADVVAQIEQVDSAAIAVETTHGTLTYGELRDHATELAHRLGQHGAGPGTVVALHLPRSPEWIIAMLAAWTAGAGYLPLSPDDTPEYTAAVARAAGVHVSVSPGLTIGTAVHTPTAASPAGIAWVVTTSGTSGQPKTVRVPQAAAINTVTWYREELGTTAADRVLVASAPTFDLTQKNIWAALTAGATLLLAAPEFDPAEVARLAAARAATVLNLAPSALRVVQEADTSRTLHRLRVLVLGGEALHFAEVAPLRASGVRVINSYGPSEAADVVCAADAPASCSPGSQASVPIGRPLPGVRLHVLDSALHTIGAGQTGELYIGGICLAHGYTDAPLTAQRFIANPFGSGERLYRTGDLARWGVDGQLEFRGRTDLQLKVRGVRVDPEAIESLLRGQPDVEDAVVLVRPGTAAMVAYVTTGATTVRPDPSDNRLADQLIQALATQLPRHMIPSAIVPMREFPLTRSGKIDRAALPAPPSAAARAPETRAESVLCEAAADVLGLDSVHPSDAFFVLGGDSILALQLVARARSLGILITTRDVFEQRTLDRIASVSRCVAPVSELAELPGGGTGWAPLTPIMKWLFERGGQADRCTQAVLLHAPSELTATTLTAALQTLLDHHDILRATITANGIRIPPTGTVSTESLVKVVDTCTGGTTFSTHVHSELHDAAARLNTERGVLLQAVLFTKGERDGDRHVLLVLHHFAVDGVSWRILIPDLAAAWLGTQHAAAPQLPPAGTSFRRWAHGLAQGVSHRRSEISDWRSVLSDDGWHIGRRPLDPRIDTCDTVARLEFTIPPKLTDLALRVAAESVHGTAEDVLIASLAIAILSWRRHGRITVMAERHGRDENAVPGADLSRTVGWFTALVPVVVELGAIDVRDALRGGQAAGTALKRVKEQLRAHQGTGIGYGMLRYLADDTALDAPPPQILVNHLGQLGPFTPGDWAPSSAAGVLLATTDPASAAPAALEVTSYVAVEHSLRQLVIQLGYVTTLLSSDDAEQLAAHWRSALHGIASYAQSPDAGGLTPSDVLAAVTQNELDTLCSEYPGTEDIWPLTPLQEGLLFQAQLAGEEADPYVVQVILEIGATPDPLHLERAFTVLLERHPQLGVSFATTASGHPVQIIAGGARVPVHVVDLAPRLGAAERESALRRTIDADRATPFDLAKGPPIRVTLIRSGSDTGGQDRHYLVLTHHHLILDGWSTPLYLREVFAACHAGRNTTVPPLRRYLEWLNTRDRETSLRAWRGALRDIESPTLLAAEPATATRSELRHTFDATTTAAVSALARRCCVTVSTVVQAAWAFALAAETGEQTVVFGTAVSGRPPSVSGVEEMIGLLINTVPVALRIHPGEMFAELLTRFQKEQANLLEHHHTSLAEIHSIAPAARFDSLLVFESYPVEPAQAFAAAPWRVNSAEVRDGSHYPFTLVTFTGQQLALEARFDEGSVTRARAQRLVQRVARLLESADNLDYQLVSAFDVCSTETAHLKPVRGADGTPPVPLAQLFSAAVAQHADRIAIVDGARTLTYQELDEWSTRLARCLQSRGAGPEVVVAIAVPRSAEYVAAMLAVTKTGAAFLPVDPHYPQARITMLLEDSGAALGVTMAAQHTLLVGRAEWMVLDSPVVEHESQDQNTGALPVATHPDSAAYVIYTSGSTGTPKGVVVTHRGLASFTQEQFERYDMQSDSRILHFASPSFDASILEFLLALGAGATLVIAPEGIAGGAELTQLLLAQRVTHAFLTPGVLATLGGSEASADLSSLQTLIAGGEPVPAQIVTEWSCGRRFFNGYGPTETTIMATISNALWASGVPVIGPPVRGASVAVLDSALRPVPEGVPGELYIMGAGLARGYHARSGLTATRFIASTCGEPGERMYRTGDRGIWLRDSDGQLTLQHIGRTDAQVKLRGFRIELGEVDGHLLEHPVVRSAATVLATGPDGTDVLASYVVTSDSRCDAEVLRRFLRQRVPSHLVPAAISILDELPLTANGKVDRQRLPSPAAEKPAGGATAPRNAAEAAVASAFERVLLRAVPGTECEFFDLGGNSLSATRLVAQVNDALRVQLSVRDVFDNPSVAALAARAAASQTGTANVETSGGTAPENTRPAHIPLAPSQQRIWFANRLDATSPAYNVAFTLTLKGDTSSLDLAALQAALTDLCARHEVLRTIYPDTPSGPTQHVLPPTPSRLDVVTVGSAELEDLRAAAVNRGFDISRAAPFRAVLFDTGDPGVWVLLIVVHHIAIDGASLAPLARDLITAYAARRAGKEPAFPALPRQFIDYALWHRRILGSPADPNSLAAHQLAFWKQTLGGYTPRPLLPETATGASTRAEIVEFAIGAAVCDNISALARATGTSPFMVLHATLALLLARVSGQHDIVIATPVHGRGGPEFDDLAGMFVNTVALRSRIAPSGTFRDVLSDTRAAALAAFDNADIPFDVVVKECGLSQTRFADVMLALNNTGPVDVSLPGLTVTAQPAAVTAVKNGVTIEVTEVHSATGEARDLAVRVIYDASRFAAAAMARFAQRFQRMLRTVAAEAGSAG